MKRSTLAVLVVVFGLALFAVARLSILFAYSNYFDVLSFGRVLYSFVNGIRFDASVMMVIIGPVALMLLIPFKFRAWKYFWGWLAFVAYIVFAFILMTDIVYFGEAQRHLSTEVRYLSNESDFVASVLIDYILFIIVFLAVVLFFAFLWNKLLRKPYKPERFIWLKMFVCVIVSFAMLHGSFKRKALTTIDAYKSGVVEGVLTINGVYTIYRHWAKHIEPIEYYLDNSNAIRIAGGNPDDVYPLLKHFPGKENKKNVILFVMESWGSYYTGVLNNYKYDVTPNFDKLAKEGALFHNHYAVERRSIDGVQALLTGILPIDSIGNLGYGLEVKANGNIGRLAQENGYETIFVRTARRRSYYMDSVTAGLGFKHYYGDEDIPTIMDYPKLDGAIFGWDYDALVFLENVIDEQSAGEKPFLAVFVSGTTHAPYPEFYPPFNRYSGNTFSNFLNAMEYSDYSLGEFMRKAAEKPWFKDTIFIITADHAEPHGQTPSYDWIYRAPLLLYSPGNIEAADYYYITSHLDVFPTIFDVAGIKGSVATTGRSVLDLSANGDRYAFIGNKGVNGIIKEDVYVEVRGNHIVASSNPGSTLIGCVFTEELLAQAEPGSIEYKELKAAQLVLALEQSVDLLVNTNRWNKRD